jgi:hypothetical protein
MTKMRTSAVAASRLDHSDFVDTCSSLVVVTGLDPRWQRMKAACDHSHSVDEYDYTRKQTLSKHAHCSVRYLQCVVVMACPV